MSTHELGRGEAAARAADARLEPEAPTQASPPPTATPPSASDAALAQRVSWILGAALVAALAFVVYQVLSHFAAGLAWAVILAVSVWPVHRRIRARLDRWPGLAAFTTILLVTLGLIVPLTTIGVLLVRELETLSTDLRGDLSDQVAILEDAASRLPLVGEPLREALVLLRQDTRAAVKALFGDHGGIVLTFAGQTAGAVSRTLFKLVVCLFTAFFLFRHGDSLAAQLRTAGRRVGGQRLEVILQHVGLTVRAVVYGLVMTAAVQGVAAAVGFWVAGVPFPWLLGALTMVLSFVPMGHAVVWVPAAVYLVLEQKIGRAHV